MPAPQKFFLSAGEASGEQYGTQLLQTLHHLAPGATFFGLGGPRMAAAGLERIVRAEDVAVMGITEIVRHIPRIYGEYRKLKRSIEQHRPDAAILIDFPDVNLRLAADLHRLKIPVIFFVSPQLWAWKKHRIRQVQRNIDRMLVIFPFEERFYSERNVNATFVGHPLADLPLPEITREAFATRHRLDPQNVWIGLLPGSREKEIRLNLPTILDAAVQLAQSEPNIEFLLPLAPTLTAEHRQTIHQMLQAYPKTRIVLNEDARATLHHARASVVASGTATVEAAHIGNPFLVVYRISPLSYAIAKRVVTVPYVAMVNLIAGREVVPELIQDDFTPANLVLHLQRLLHDQDARQTMKSGLSEVATRLHAPKSDPPQTAIERVARTVLKASGYPEQGEST